MQSDRKTKLCPFCGEEILADAVKCRFCKEFLDEPRENDLPVSRHAVPNLPERPESPQPSERQDREDKITPLLKRPLPNPTPSRRPEINLTVVPSALGLSKPFAVLLCFVAAAVALMVLPFDKWAVNLFSLSEEAAGRLVPPVQIIHTVGFVIGMAAVLRFIYQVLALKSVRYEITADRIEWSRGIFSRRIDNIDMFRVADIKLHRSLLDCLLGIGAVVLITKDQTDPLFEFKKVRRPRVVYDTIKTAALAADRKQGVVHLD